MDYRHLEQVAARLLDEPGLSAQQRILALSVKGIAETLATKVVAHAEDVEALRVLGCHLGETLLPMLESGGENLMRNRELLLDLCDCRQRRATQLSSVAAPDVAALAARRSAPDYDVDTVGAAPSMASDDWRGQPVVLHVSELS